MQNVMIDRFSKKNGCPLHLMLLWIIESEVWNYQEKEQVCHPKNNQRCQKCDFETSNLSKREWNELMESFGFKEKIPLIFICYFL